MQYSSATSKSIRPKTQRSYAADRFFHLPTVIVRNDILLSGAYDAVLFIIDDHPYPKRKEDFLRRTCEIRHYIQNLQLSPMQIGFLHLLEYETNIELVDLWHGSHVIVCDNGVLYDIWSKLEFARPRSSSHYKNIPVQQYGINFDDHQLLFGKTSAKGATWFQMEAHGFDANNIYNNPKLFICHGHDFIKYRIHHMNVGPFGVSPHTETDSPIVLSYRRLEKQNFQKQKLSKRLNYVRHRKYS